VNARSPALHAEPAFIKGHFEIQDEGSQTAALLAGALPGEQVVDLCAGAGGKTLALAAAMDNRGQLYATDFDKRRLAPIYARIERAGVRNAQVLTPLKGGEPLADLNGCADLVVVDAPCTGAGAWRRNPDAKWRVRPSSLDRRLQEQVSVLDRAAGLVKPGGRLAYITCSVLDEENSAQIRAFAARRPEFSVRRPTDVVQALGARANAFLEATLVDEQGVLMTPLRTNTDGFFVSLLQRSN
jgi:16S rRNA (cytosine967-C5)-methyltransferase